MYSDRKIGYREVPANTIPMELILSSNATNLRRPKMTQFPIRSARRPRSAIIFNNEAPFRRNNGVKAIFRIKPMKK